MSYKVMTYDPIDVGWEDDGFASGWTATYCSLTRDGDTAKLKLDTGYAGGWIQKGGLGINASTYKYCVVCIKGTDRFFVEVYDGSWKSITNGHEVAPSEYEVKVYDLSGITGGTITDIRLGVGDAQQKEAYYDFIAFVKVQPQFATDKVISLAVRQRESDVDEFEISGTDDISGLTIGRHLRIFIKGNIGEVTKVFAGVIEEATPEDSPGKVLKITGRCFGQKLLLRTKSKNFSGREISLAVKDFVEDLSEITTFQVETPSPMVYVTKDFPYEYIMDALKDLARRAGSDWEVKLGMGHDLRFRSRGSSNVPSVPITISEVDGHILRGVRKETDGYREYNKVTVLGGELCNIDNDPDKYTDEGDIANWGWQIFGGGGGSSIYEDAENIAYGKRSIWCVWTLYSNELTAEFSLGSTGVDLTPFKYMRFMHRSTGISKSPAETNFYFRVRLRDTAYRNAVKTYLPNNVQPPQNFAEVMLALSEFTVDSGFDWQHVRWVQFQCISDRVNPGEGVGGYYWLDKVFFWAKNIVASKTTTSTDFRHTREYVYKDEKLLDPSFLNEVADALLNVLKDKELHYRVPIIGIPSVQVGHKTTVNSPTHGLSGTYYIVEAEHKINQGFGYITEMVLEKPRLSLEALLTAAIERKIRLIERGTIA